MVVNGSQSDASKHSPNTFPLLYIGVMIFIAYCIVLVVRSVWHGIDQSKAITQKQAEVDEMNLRIAIEQRFIVYQKTSSYIDRQAREHFGYARPGETTVILPENVDTSQAIANEEAGSVAQKKQKVEAPNPTLWWQYLMGR